MDVQAEQWQISTLKSQRVGSVVGGVVGAAMVLSAVTGIHQLQGSSTRCDTHIKHLTGREFIRLWLEIQF